MTDTSNWLADAEAAERRRRREAAGGALMSARGIDPAAAAAAERAGAVLGFKALPVPSADLAEEARVQKNMEALSQAHRTAGWISDPNNAAVAHDQVESLTGIEGLLSVMRSDFAKQYIDGPRQIAGGLYEAIGGSLYGLGLTGERALDRFGLSESARQASRVPGMAFLNAPAFLKEVGARNRRAASYLRGDEGSERALSSGAPDLLPRLNYDRGFVGDVEAGLGQIAGQVLMHVGSGGMASLPSMFGQGVTQMDERVQEAQAREGRTEYSAKDDAALAAGGVVTALTEKLGLDAVIGALPAPIRSRLTSKIADIGVAGLTEGLSEAAEGVGQNAIARYVLGEETALLDGSVAYEGGVGATVGSLARALVLTAVPGRQHSIDAQRAERAKSQHETFDAAVQAAVQNPLRERSPERFASFLRDAAEGGSEVYVPAEAVATFFQSNPDLDVWMDEWDIRDQVEEALAAGTDVVFDQATYLAKVAPTAAHAAWGEDLRHGIDGMSKREAADFEATGEERLTGEIDAAIDQAQAEEAQVAPERQVRDAIFSQLRETGYTLDAANAQATIAARTFASLAERNPEVFADAMAAYQDASLTIKQDFPEVIRQSMDRIDAMIEGLRRRSARPTDRRLFGRSMMEFLAQRGGVIDTGGELAALGVDSWHRPSQGGKAFRRRFIRDGAMGGNEFAPDLAALAAVEAGYLPEGSGPNELFAAIRDELAGRPVYSQAFETDLQSKENADALDELERLLGDLGIDPTTETDNAKIKAALERAAEPFPGDAAATYDQAGRLKTDTPAFKAWFGESKVVDENGDPLVVYHGTNQPIEQFSVERLGASTRSASARHGFFFTSDEVVAQLYADNAARTVVANVEAFEAQRDKLQAEVGRLEKVAQRTGKAADWQAYEDAMPAWEELEIETMRADDTGQNVVSVYLSIQNPKVVDFEGEGILRLEGGFGDLIADARKEGYDGLILRNIDDTPNMSRVSDHFVAFEPTQIKSVFNQGTFDPSDPRILYQDTPFTGPRGQISLAQGRATITLFQSRDLSTFFHEFGHLTLEMLIDVASHLKASAQTKADLQTVLEWFGAYGEDKALSDLRRMYAEALKSAERKPDDAALAASAQRIMEAIEFAESQGGAKYMAEVGRTFGENVPDTYRDVLRTPFHELWARGTERYLMEGKAPSLELREVFRTVAAWLKRIYSTVLALDAPITDDVRAVMDRLLASDAEIAQARQVSGQETGVDVLRQQGMTDAEAAAYEKAVARARSDAESDLLGKVMGAIRRRVTKEWNDAAEEIRPEITAEVDRMPDIAAIEFITTTRTPLDRETVVAMLGDEAGLSLLPKRVPPIFSATGGQHPDMVAEAAGYRSGQELLNGLMDHAAEKKRLVEAGDKRSVRQARIEERVREALLDRFGDVLNDGSIEQEAIDAIHSERYGDILAMDLAVLARKAGQQPAPIDALRAWARERVGSRPVREARPGRYLRAERSASTAVQKALAAGDRDEAFRQKQAQVINNVLYVEAGRAERFAEAAINRMRKLARGRNPSIHVDYMEQINAILEQYELKEVSGRTIQRRKSLAAFKEELEKAGEPVNIPADVLASLDKTNLADLTVDELRGLDETVKHLIHLGRMKTKLIVMGEERDLNRVGDEVLERSAYIKDRKISEAPGAQTWLEERRADFDGAVAALRKMQEIARRMDGSDTDGPFHDNLDRPSMEAANRKARLAADFYTPIKAAVDAIPKEIKARWMDTLSDHPFVNPRTGVPLEGMKRADLIAVALNVGTLSNFESMAKGWGVISSEADAVAVSAARLGMIQWLNERLDASEWAYVQAWWDAHERLRGEYFAAARKVEGFEPEAVDAEPVTTPAGVLKGGYAPLIYHPDFDEATLQRNQMDDADPLGGLGRSGPRPDNGATISRTGYSGPVDLRMDSHRMAADKHLTYAAYAEFVSNALKFINHRTIREAVITKLGKPVYDTIRPWLESQVRNDTVNDPNAKFWQKILRQSRSNIVMASLLGSVTVMLAQGSGLVASAAKVGPVKLARGVAAEIRLNRMTGGEGVFDYVAGKSDFMRLRLEEGELDRDIRFALAKSQAGVKLKADAAALAGKAIAAVDFYLVSGPTWLGVYESEIEAGRDEADAVYAADMAVSTTQGGGRARDMSGFMRGNDALKMGTIAFGWASAFENMVSGAVFDIRHGQNVGRNVGMLSALFILMPLMDAVMSGDLPEPGDDDEETLANYADWFMRNVVTNLFVGIPFARDLASWAERDLAGEYTGTIGQTPNGRILSEFTRLYKDIKAAVDDEKDVSHRWPAHVISAVGYSFGIPGTSQAARATNYGLDVAVGDQNPETALDVVTGVVRGPQDDQR